MHSEKNRLVELTSKQGQALVALARQTLAVELKREVAEEAYVELETRLQDDIFKVHCGAFVTLKHKGRLRGCIGTLAAREALSDSVRNNAINAAFNDPRFKELTGRELDRIEIEISVLTPPRPVEYKDVGELLDHLRPFIDGVTIRKHSASATFLPQVWEQLPEKEDFLAQLCRKAGLPADAWRKADLSVETYQVQSFYESH